EGFVGCNEVIDWVDFFLALLGQWPSVVAGPVISAGLHGWLDNLAQAPGVPQQLLTSAAVQSVNQGPFAPRPWKRINRWAAVEAVLRTRTGGCHSPNVRMIALNTFNAILATSGLLPPSCRCPAAAVTTAFLDWWKVTADCLTAVFDTYIWPNRAMLAQTNP